MNRLQQNPDFTPPYNPEAEKAVLGAVLLETEAYYRINETLSVNMFYSQAHQILYSTIENMHKNSVPVDMVTVSEALIKNKTLDIAGGPIYISDLISNVVSTAHIEEHALYIRQEYIRREVMTAAGRMLSSLSQGNDVYEVLNHSCVYLNTLEEGAINTDTLKPLREVADRAIRQAEQRVSNHRQGKQNGIPTGSRALDKITGGWQNGDLIIIAARPAMGKTALSLMLMEAAAESNYPVAIFNLEMKGERLADRIILEKTGIEDWKYKQGYLSNEEMTLVEECSTYLFSLPVHIDDNSSQTISKIKSKCRILKKKNKLRLIIIDYLQLTEGEGDALNREQEVARISREAKKMAKALDVPVIMLSQLNRSLESRADKRPQLSDIRESGAIEQDADMVIFIHRPEYYNHELKYKETTLVNGVELIISKYREGATGSVFLQHDGKVRNFKDYHLSKELPF